MDITGLIKNIYAGDYVSYLIVLIIANLALGIAASLRKGDFKLTRLADWLLNRVVPLTVGYGVAALLAYAQPQYGVLRDAAFGTLTLTLLGYIMSNLADLGIPVPASLANLANRSQ